MAKLDPDDYTNIAAAVWNRVVVGDKTQAWQALQDVVAKQIGYGVRTEDIQNRVAALQNAVVEFAASANGLTADEIEALVKKMLEENIVKVNVDVGGQ